MSRPCRPLRVSTRSGCSFWRWRWQGGSYRCRSRRPARRYAAGQKSPLARSRTSVSLMGVPSNFKSSKSLVERRVLMLLLASTLGGFSIWMLLSELPRSGIQRLPINSDAAAIAATARARAAWAAAFGGVRGDLWAESATPMRPCSRQAQHPMLAHLRSRTMPARSSKERSRAPPTNRAFGFSPRGSHSDSIGRTQIPSPPSKCPTTPV